jgi:transposase InsO family protein
MPKRFRKTTDSAHDFGYAENLVQQRFTVSEPNRLWVSDISYVQTWQGWLYIAVILDAFSRRVVGYAVDDHKRTELALQALQMAVRTQRPTGTLVHHSDRGAQYASLSYQEALKAIGAALSMSGKGNCYDCDDAWTPIDPLERSSWSLLRVI